MKKIKCTTPCAGPGFSYSVGEVYEAPNERADDLIRAGYAELFRGGAKAPNTSKKPRAEQAVK